MSRRRIVLTSASLLALGGCAGSTLDVADAPERTLRQMNERFDARPMPTPTDVRLATGEPGPAYWQNECDYVLAATLDAEARTIAATGTVTYTNNAPYALEYLWIQLEQNLFHPDSRGARRTEAGARFGNRDGFVGGYDLAIAVGGRPVDLHVHDTLGRLDLERPLQPGESFTFDMAWSFAIPEYGSDRMGIENVEQGTVFQIAQWFPHVCKYDDVHGWNTLPYLGQGEFYTDFGDYDISITVPRSHIVACTGELRNPEEVLTAEQRRRLDQARQGPETVMIVDESEVGDLLARPTGGGPLTWRFTANDVRTVAWSSSDAFIWDACTASDSGPIENGTRRGTLVQSVYPKEARPLWNDSTDMLRFAIEGYNERWYTYPYPTAINVNGIVGGMEYPMIIFCRNRRSETGLYGVTTHEIGHNWFPMVVNTDERRHAWMDEGFNTFINYYSRLERFPDREPRRGDPHSFARDIDPEYDQPIMTASDRVERLGWLAYGKPAAGLVLLRESILGPERFDRAFRAYIERWAFRSPQPADFFRTIEDVAGEDLGWFWRGWFQEPWTMDHAVTRVDHQKNTVTIRNVGDLVMPAVVEVTHRDGRTSRFRIPVETWYLTDEWTFEVDGEIRRVQLDPDQAFPDVDPSNDAWPRN